MDDLQYMKDPQAVYDLGKALTTFGGELDQALRDLKSKHASFGHSFQGEPYDNLSDVISKVTSEIREPIAELNRLAEYARKKAEVTTEILGTKLRY